MLGRPLARLALLGMVACSAPSSKPADDKTAPDGSLTIFVTTEIKGQIEPCGCTSSPMGDLARTAAMVARARTDGPVLVVDAGSLLYSELPMADNHRHQEELTAELLVGAYQNSLQVAAIGLGPYDLAAGVAKVRPARHAANLPVTAGVALAPPEVITRGGLQIGVFGVVAPELLAPYGLVATDPAKAAAEAVKQLRRDGAQLVVALAHMPRAEARALAKAVPGLDIVVVGRDAPDPDLLGSAPIQVGTSWLVQPANRGQVVTRLDITLRGPGPLTDAVGEARAEAELAAMEERAQRLQADLTTWEADPTADPKFVAGKRAELTKLATAQQQLAAKPLQIPASGSWFVMSQQPITKQLSCDPAIVQSKAAYDEAVGKANLAAAAAETAPPAPAGKSSYTGMNDCAYCHEEAVEFWKTTRHAGAWETLEQVGKQYNLQCIYCHVTGFDKPGGSTLATVTPFQDVQCEVCHGPSSIHLEEDGTEAERQLIKTPLKNICITCHNELHSDTFQYEAYLRDVTGPGHGAELRKRLGDGTTGAQLRAAAKQQAGDAIGAGCPK